MNFLIWLEHSALAHLMRQSLYPWIQIVHIVSFSITVGAIGILDLRLLGCFHDLPVIGLMKGPLRLAHASFCVVVGSGLLLFITQPSVLVFNPAFQLKLLLIVMAGMNGIGLQRVLRLVEQKRSRFRKGAAKSLALVSLLLWLSILACGRMIAYV